MAAQGKFISCDWGTSSFRLRLIETATSRLLAKFSSTDGIAPTYADWQATISQASAPPSSRQADQARVAFYRANLERAITQLAPDLDGLPVIISGMASSSIGMLELPYKDLPFDITGADLHPTLLPPTDTSPRTILLVPGVRTIVDVMRGEETQLIGSAVNEPGTRIYVFPGTHSKHVFVRIGQAIDFRTYMTGELFSLLTKHSILSASVTAPVQAQAAAKLPESFFAGLSTAKEYPLLHSAFLTRTNQLFGRYTKEDNYQFLNGLLIGAELQELSGSIHPVTLVASSPLKELYATALEALYFNDVPVIDADEALLKGHCAIFAWFGATIAP